MAIVGRALRQKWANEAYERKHAAELLEWRQRNNEARRKAREDREAKFPVITAENCAEACQYQEERIAHYMGEN